MGDRLPRPPPGVLLLLPRDVRWLEDVIAAWASAVGEPGAGVAPGAAAKAL